jgi:lipoprotein-anchoring transpeptidase ErfK/SrfK
MLKQLATVIGLAIIASLLGFVPFALLSNSQFLSPQRSSGSEERPPIKPSNIGSQQQNVSQIQNFSQQDFSQQDSTIRLEVSLSKRQVALYQGKTRLKTYSIAIGRTGWETPKGLFHVNQMLQNPTWIQPFTDELIPPDDPRNPLGGYWIGFWTDGRNSIGFHGTSDPKSVGSAISHGCLRMHNQDIQELFQIVQPNTLVKVTQ